MKQHIFIASVIGVAIASLSSGAIAQTGQLVSGGCRQGYCWETYLQSQQAVHHNRLGGVESTLYEVMLESHNSEGTEQRTQWVYCSTSEPFIAFDSFGDDDLMILHYLNPGGQTVGGYNADSHRLYWAVCHDIWDADIWNPGTGLASQASQLGYSLTLEEGQREIPKVMFR